MNALPLKSELQLYHRLREWLLEYLPEVDDETIRDTLEGITDLHEMIAAVIRSALVDEALQAGLRGRLDDMKERLSRLEVRASKKRELALHAMSEAGLGKLEQPDFHRVNPRRLPCPHRRVRTGRSLKPIGCPSRQSSIGRVILGELKRGAAIPGAELSNPKPVLMVRTK